MEALNGACRLPDLGKADGISSILVVRLKALGDIALSVPIVRALRGCFPRARIRYLCRGRYAEALALVRELDDVLILPERASQQMRFALALRRERIDCTIDLLGSPRSAVLTALAGSPLRVGMDTKRHNWCYRYIVPRAIHREGKRIKCYTLDANEELVRMLGLQADPRRGCSGDAFRGGADEKDPDRYAIGFPAAESEQPWALALRTEIGGGRERLIGIVPGALYQAKSWREDYFIEIVRRLHATMDTASVILWGPGERALAERIAAAVRGSVVAPEMGIARLGALIATLDLLIGIDSGPKHLAVVQGIPTVTLFGPTDPRIWDPMTERHRALYLGADCSPCRRKECVPNRCLEGITPDMVMPEVVKALAAGRRAERGGANR